MFLTECSVFFILFAFVSEPTDEHRSSVSSSRTSGSSISYAYTEKLRALSPKFSVRANMDTIRPFHWKVL